MKSTIKNEFNYIKVISSILIMFLILCTTSFNSTAHEPTNNTQQKIYYIRFASSNVPVYDQSSNIIAYLANNENVFVIEGPINNLAKIRVISTGIEGYVEVKYLKLANAIVNDTDIYTYEEMVDDILALANQYPNLLKFNCAGNSLDNRPIYDLTLGNPNASKSVMIHAGIHGREHTNPYLVMEQLEMALDFYYSGSFNNVTYQQLFSQIAVHIVPMVNPDGIAISQFGENGVRNEEFKQILRECYKQDRARKWTKKSYSEYLKRWKANARGVDVNRNFPAEWNHKVNTTTPAYGFYNGTAALSEPEAKILATLTLQYKPLAVISYHSTGSILYWNSSLNNHIGSNNAFTNMIKGLTGYKLQPTFTANGGYLEWVQSFDYQVLTTTIETGVNECPLAYKEYPSIWFKNYSILLNIANYVR